MPETTYQEVEARGLPVSELLQRAIEAELAQTDRYFEELIAEVGEPTARE